jgi:hypothetical protein
MPSERFRIRLWKGLLAQTVTTWPDNMRRKPWAGNEKG